MFKDKLLKRVFGMEFKDNSITAVCMKNDLSGINLLSSATFPLKDDDETITAIKNFIDKYKADTGKVFVSIPEKWAIIKFTEMPLPKGKNSVSQLIRYEIEKHIPFQIDEIFYDSMVVDTHDSTCKVAIVAVQKEKVEPIRMLFERLDMKIDGITISHFGMLSAIELSGITIGGWQETLGFAKKSVIWGRKEEIGISLLLNKNEAVLSVMKNNLCLYFKTFPFDSDRSLDTVSGELSSIISDMLSGLSIQKADTLILSGDIIFLPNLSDALRVKLGIKTVIVNPLSGLLGPDKASEMQWLAPSVGTSLSGFGIGTLRLNLLPHKAEKEGKKIGSLITKISIPLIILLGISILAGEIANKKKLLSELEQTFKKNQSEIAVVEKLSGNIKTLEGQRDFFMNTRKNDTILNMLLEFTTLIPQDAWIANLSYKESEDKKHRAFGELVISGYAVSSSRLISILEDSPLFEKVEFAGPIKKIGGKEDFKIKAVIPFSEKPS